jgi:hypothetical protein
MPTRTDPRRGERERLARGVQDLLDLLGDLEDVALSPAEEDDLLALLEQARDHLAALDKAARRRRQGDGLIRTRYRCRSGACGWEELTRDGWRPVPPGRTRDWLER